MDIRVVFMGTPDFAALVLSGLIGKYNVVGVVSQPDKIIGRSKEKTFTPVKKLATENNITVLQPEKVRNNYDEILALKPDIIITCAYGQIIPKALLDYPKYGCINVHASLLPKLRGGAPIHRSIIEGYKKTGITIMYMDEAMDSGDIISQAETDILDTDNLETLSNRLSVMGKDLLLDTLPSIINGTNKRIKQDLEQVTYAYNIKREEEHLDFTKNSREILNKIRGLYPVPAANVIFNDLEMKVYDAYISDKKFLDKKPGDISGLYKKGIGVVTGDGEIILTDIKPFGKKRMNAFSYINGLRDKDKISRVY